MSEKFDDVDLSEITKKAFEEELSNYLKDSEKNSEQEADKGSTSENAMGKEKKEKQPTPYTIEELRKLSETEKENAIEKIDEKRIETELQEKFKALQGMATKRQQYLAEKEKEYDKKIEEYSKILNDLTEMEKRIKDKLEELKDIDPEIDSILNDLEDKRKGLSRQNEELVKKNWDEAVLAVREIFPDFGKYSEQEMTETLKQNPRLLELAAVDYGRYGDIVLAATHILTMLKENNFKNLIAEELEKNPKKYQDIIDKIITKKIEEMEKKNEKKKNFTKLTESQEIKEASTIPQKGKENVEYKHKFKEEFINLMNNPDLLEEIREKMKGG